MAGTRTKTKTKTAHNAGSDLAAQAMEHVDEVLKNTASADESTGFDDFGGEALSGEGADIEEFIKGEDLAMGAIVHGNIVGAKLLPDEDHGGYRAVFAIELKRDLGPNRKGSIVGLGERTKLRVLRNLTLGSEVMVRADGKKKLKKGGKTMHTFSIKARANTVTGALTVQQLLSKTWKNSGASADEWNAVQNDTSFPDEPGSEG